MKIAGTLTHSLVNGDGWRFVIFTQGCPHHCPGCQNPDTHDPAGGEEVSLDYMRGLILDQSKKLTDGVTFSGGDPFMQPAECAELAEYTHSLGLDVWAYTGWTYEELLKDPAKKLFLEKVDVLVDGPFLIDKKSETCKFRGSTNQRIINVPKSLLSGQVILWENQ